MNASAEITYGPDADALLGLTATLIDIPSVSRDEEQIVAWLRAELERRPWLTVDQVGMNLVARTNLGRSARVVLAGHTDTVPVNGNATAVRKGDTVRGLGASDMKGGLAVGLALACDVAEPAVDVTYVFYAREEIAAVESGLAELIEARPDLLAGDCAILGEPTGAEIEAGCQGTMRARIRLRGERAHTARPWMGRNAVHRIGALMAILDACPAREPVIDGCRYREAVQAVHVVGGVAGNVVPDDVTVLVNHRFAPDRTAAEAEAFLRTLVAPVFEDGDEFEIVDVSEGALPSLSHPLLRRLVDANNLSVVAKYGWTDVARFASLGIPATNFGPGDSALAHTAGEWVSGAAMMRVYAALHELLTHDI